MRIRRPASILALVVLTGVWLGLEVAAQQGGGLAQQGGGLAGRGGGAGGRGGGPQPRVGSMPSRRFEKIAEGVYYATSTGSMSVGSNACVIVSDQDALIVDPGEGPATAKAFLEDIKSITNKPVHFVVDSHTHFDHAHGNQIFGPEVTLIGNDRARQVLLRNVLQEQAYATQASPELLQQRLDAARQQLQSATDPQQRPALERQVAALQLRVAQEKEVKPTPPNTTFSTRMTLYRGNREIQILNLGRAHTDTDIVLFLPQERIACTGDMMENQLSYMADGFVDEWPATLEKLMTLDFDTVLPGHGTPFKGKEKVRAYQAYLRDLSKQVAALRQQGMSPEETAKRVDLTAHAAAWPSIRGAGVDLRAVQRMYDLAANPSAPVRGSDPKYPVIWIPAR